MKRKPFLSLASAALASGLSLVVVMFFAGCAGEEKEANSNPVKDIPLQNQNFETETPEKKEPLEAAELPKVYFTSDITPAGLRAAYEALEKKPSAAHISAGKVAVKVHTGEGANSNHLRPAFIKDLVELVNGTIVEGNTVYPGSSRGSTAAHMQVARDRGFTAIAKVDILDSSAEMSLPITGGSRLTENFVGSHFTRYDFYVVLSHFKGHISGGFGGAIKNISIGIASKGGKAWIHTAGRSKTDFSSGAVQNEFLDAMAEAGKSVVDRLNGNIIYINVMNNMSIECDCFANPAKPDMHDIGILSSTDPVALDQACVDLVYAAPESERRTLVARMVEKNGIRALDRGAAIGLGSKTYELVDITGGTSVREPGRYLPGK